MRRRAIGQRVEKEPKALAGLFVAEAERLEHPRLHVLSMNSYAAGTEFDAIEHQVIALRAALPRRGLELVEIFFEDSGKRMLRTHPAFFVLAPFKKRKTRDPHELPFAAIDQVQPVPE